MVNTVDQVKEFVASKEYQDTVIELKSILRIVVDDAYEDFFAARNARSLSASGFDLDVLKDVLQIDRNKIIQYSARKFKATHNKLDEQDGQQEIDSVISFGNYSQGFLLINLIEIVLARHGKDVLEEYLRESKIPKYKAYAKDVICFVSDVDG